MELKTRLKSLRLEHNLTQKQLAELSGITERGYQNYEIGQRIPTLNALIALADFFNVSLDYLVGRSDER